MENPEPRHKFAQLTQPPVFIVGPARSGTTWIYDIFNSHPDVAGVYESWLFTPNNGVRSLFSDAHYPPKRSGLGRLLAEDALRAEAKQFVMAVMSHAIGPEHCFLVEKSPNHLYQIRFIKSIFPDARFICVIRDGRDVAVSVRAAANSWVPSWKNSFGQSVKASARAWNDALRFFRRAALEFEGDCLEVRYESVIAQPKDLYRTLFTFCGIDFDDTILDLIFTKTDFQTNYKPGEDKFRRGGRIGDWRTHFNRADARVFKQEAGELLIELGYEQDMRWQPNRRW